MRSLRRITITPREDWAYLHALAQDEFSRERRRKQSQLDDRSRVLMEQWLPSLGELGPQLSSHLLSARVPVGALVGDLRDLTGSFQSAVRDPLWHTRILFCCALVAACRANPDYAPESLFGHLRFLVASARREKSRQVLGHIVAVVRGETGHACR
jgi:hypothetical protein